MDYPKVDLREEQIVNENTHVHLLAGGRGSGKTRAGTEWVTTDPVDTLIVTPTEHSIRETIAEGESGLYSATRAKGHDIYSERGKPYFASTYRFSENDARVHVTDMNHLIPVIGSINADLGTPVERVWIDEAQNLKLRDWKILHEAFPDAQYLLTFTPTTEKNKLLSYLYLRAGAFRPKYMLYTMSSFDNAHNLHKNYVEKILGVYAGTDAGKSQLHGEYRREYYA
ncbi:terminase large subunit [Microbacterium phage A3Wally]|nr:terminase large subunit [Microbacterium phage A3Wally]